MDDFEAVCYLYVYELKSTQGAKGRKNISLTESSGSDLGLMCNCVKVPKASPVVSPQFFSRGPFLYLLQIDPELMSAGIWPAFGRMAIFWQSLSSTWPGVGFQVVAKGFGQPIFLRWKGFGSRVLSNPLHF